MKELTCIICPNGCRLLIDDDLNVTGNLCIRGKDFAINEIKDPRRTVTSTCKTAFKEVPVVAVKTDGEIRKDDILKVIEEINKIVIDKRMSIGEVVINNVLNSGVNIVLSSNALMEETK